MISAEELSALLGSLYAAPLEPEKWQVFMDRLCVFASISCGYLIGSYPGQGSVLLAGGGGGFDTEMFRLYNEHYAAQDPYVKVLLTDPRTGSMAGDDLVDRATLIQSEVYNDFLVPYGLDSTHAVICNCNHEQLEGLSLWRGPKQGPMDANSRTMLEILLPHLQTALKLSTNMLQYERTRVFSETALDAMSIAAFLVTGNGRVRHMNRMAARFIGKGEALQICNGRLVPSDSAKAAQLEMIMRAATSGSVSELHPGHGGAIRLLRASAGSKLQVTVVPVPEASEIASLERHAVLFVSDPAAAPASRAAMMKQMYGLTATECRLTDLLLEGLEVREAGERLHITLETARFHLKRVLAKTGARRQSELMRLMLLLPGVNGSAI